MGKPLHPNASPGPVHPARGEGGAAAVEMAIVLPVLLLILFGIIDMGRLLQQQIVLTGAVREAARIGALNATPSAMRTQVTTIVGTATGVAVPTAAPCGATSGSADSSTVVATRAFQPLTPLAAVMSLFGSTSSGAVTLRATGVMACLG